MSDKLTCSCCGKWTDIGHQHLAQRAKQHPIYGTDFSVPLSQTIESIRQQIVHARGQLGDIASAYPAWKDRTKDVEGLLTCGLVTLAYTAKEMKELEKNNE